MLELLSQPSKRKCVVSHKVLLEELIAEQRSAIILKLEKGLVLEGTVKAISDFGVFVDLGGVDGFGTLLQSLSWGRVAHLPVKLYRLIKLFKVVVLDFDTDKKRYLLE